MYLVLFFLCLLLNMKLSGHRELFDLFSHCVTLVGGPTGREGEKKNPALFYNFLLEKLQRHNVLLPFVVVVYAVLLGKFPAHPGGEGIMTGLLSSEEEIRAEFQQSLLDCFSYIVRISSALI